jgi:hypothetical protein
MISLREFDSTMPSNVKLIELDSRIFKIRRQRVMLDSDLATIYGTSTRRLNEQFKRNCKRFPDDFAFVLTREEFMHLISQNAISKQTGRGGRRKLPIVFTEHGAIMLASVLNSDIAVRASVLVVRAFVKLREMVAANTQFANKLEELERRIDSHDEAIVDLFAALKRLLEPPEPSQKREIGFQVREKSGHYRVTKNRKSTIEIQKSSNG